MHGTLEERMLQHMLNTRREKHGWSDQSGRRIDSGRAPDLDGKRSLARMQADNDARSLQWLQSIKSRYASIRGADPSPSKKPGGMNPNVFFDAVSRRDLEYARRILMDEGDVNIRNSSGSTLCHVAVKSGDLDMLKAILQFRPGSCIPALRCSNSHALSADVNMKENDEVGGSTALHAATLLGELEMVKELLDAGADPRVQDKEGRTPLHVCAMKGYLEIAERLLESS
eukprot:762853-Hanusia_phi.AAC.6